VIDASERLVVRRQEDGRFRRRGGWLLTTMVMLVSLASTGCMQRRLTILSDPPGALVKIDGYEVGTTPCSTSFLYYGTRKVQLIKSGYETLTLLQPIPTPWYQYPVLDFFSDNFALHEIRDTRVLRYQLQPMVETSVEDVVERGENLRNYGQTPPGMGTIPGALPPGALGPQPGPPPSGFGPGFPFQPGPERIPPGTLDPNSTLPPATGYGPAPGYGPAAGFDPNTGYPLGPQLGPGPGSPALPTQPGAASPYDPRLTPRGSRLPF